MDYHFTWAFHFLSIQTLLNPWVLWRKWSMFHTRRGLDGCTRVGGPAMNQSADMTRLPPTWLRCLWDLASPAGPRRFPLSNKTPCKIWLEVTASALQPRVVQSELGARESPEAINERCCLWNAAWSSSSRPFSTFLRCSSKMLSPIFATLWSSPHHVTKRSAHGCHGVLTCFPNNQWNAFFPVFRFAGYQMTLERH